MMEEERLKEFFSRNNLEEDNHFVYSGGPDGP
jgi:hypothetical protein